MAALLGYALLVILAVFGLCIYAIYKVLDFIFKSIANCGKKSNSTVPITSPVQTETEINTFVKPERPPRKACYIPGVEEEIEENLSLCRNVHKRAPKVITEQEVKAELANIKCETYDIPQYNKKTNDELVHLAENACMNYAIANASKNLFKRGKSIETIFSLKREEFINFYENKEEDQENDYYASQKKIKQTKDAEFKADYDKKCEPYLDLIVDDEAKINLKLTECFDSIDSFHKDLPVFTVSGNYKSKKNNTCEITILLPSADDCIDQRKILPSGNISSKTRDYTDIRQDYDIFMSGVAMYVSGKVFNVNTSIENIHITAKGKDTIGMDVFAYYIVNRQQFSSIDFSLLQSDDFRLRYLFHSPTKPKVRVPINQASGTNAQKRTYAKTSTKKQPSKVKTSANKKKSQQEISEKDELTAKSLDLVFSVLNLLFTNYGLEIFESKSRTRLLNAIRDLLPKNDGERELIEMLVSYYALSDMLEANKRSSAIKKIEQILFINGLSNTSGFIKKISDMFLEK